MSVLKETAAAVVGVCALIGVCDACFGVGEARFDDEFYRASFYAPRQPAAEFRFAADTTPAARVSFWASLALAGAIALAVLLALFILLRVVLIQTGPLSPASARRRASLLVESSSWCRTRP